MMRPGRMLQRRTREAEWVEQCLSSSTGYNARLWEEAGLYLAVFN